MPYHFKDPGSYLSLSTSYFLCHILIRNWSVIVKQHVVFSWHQFTILFSPIHGYCFNEIWCYDYFNDAVKCILMPPQDLEKVGWFQSRKKQKVNECFDKKNHGLVNWWIDVTNKIIIYIKSSNTIENCTFNEKSLSGHVSD